MSAKTLCRCLVQCLLLLGFSSAAMSQSWLSVTVVDKAGEPLPNATVSVADEWLAAEQQGQPETVVIDQVARQFTPFMTSIKAGSEVVFPNSDNIRHHVYSFSQPKPFELRLYSDEERPSVAFPRAGLVTLGCNIHDQMIAHVVITDKATAWVTNEQGQVRLPLKAGARGVNAKVWHPRLGNELSKSVSVTLSMTGEQQVSLPVAAEEQKQEKKSRLEQRFGRGL